MLREFRLGPVPEARDGNAITEMKGEIDLLTERRCMLGWRPLHMADCACVNGDPFEARLVGRRRTGNRPGVPIPGVAPEAVLPGRDRFEAPIKEYRPVGWEVPLEICEGCDRCR